MKLSFLLLTFLICNLMANAQKTYTETMEAGGTKIMKGLLSKEIMVYEPSFTWFAANEKNYTPNTDAVSALKLHANDIQIIAFGGTWCDDTKNIVPKFYTLLTTAGFNQGNLSFFGVDRSKKTYGALAEALGITNVPTFIIMKNGKEQGRVIEYGKTGQWDKEIGEIISSMK